MNGQGNERKAEEGERGKYMRQSSVWNEMGGEVRRKAALV